MTKCEVCGQTVQKTFLDKKLGTIIKDEKGKQHEVCSSCQSKLKNREEILKNIK